MNIYIDNEYKCHVDNDGTLREVSTEFFDGKCKEFIEGYRYVPAGETWHGASGIFPWKRYIDLFMAQADADRRELDDAVPALKTLGIKDNFSSNATLFRPIIEQAVTSLPDGKAAKIPTLFVKWEAGKRYEVGDRREDDGVLYKCKQGHTSQLDWKPAQTPALWDRIDVEHEGTLDDPIPAAVGLVYYKDKYYSEEDKMYLCNRDDTGSGTVLYYMPSQLVGLYFSEVSNE